MKTLMTFILMLSATPWCFAKAAPQWHTGKLVLVSAQYSDKYSVALFTDDGQGAKLWGVGVQGAEYKYQFQCPGCLAAGAFFDRMLASCSYGQGDECKVERSIRYQVADCRKCGAQARIGMEFPDGTSDTIVCGPKSCTSVMLWLVAPVAPAAEVSKTLAEESNSYAAKSREIEKEKARELAEVNAQQSRLLSVRACLLALKVGSPESSVYDCGYPDHTNSDLEIDQLVYPDDLFVYINKRTGLVENIQWSH